MLGCGCNSTAFFLFFLVCLILPLSCRALRCYHCSEKLGGSCQHTDNLESEEKECEYACVAAIATLLTGGTSYERNCADESIAEQLIGPSLERLEKEGVYCGNMLFEFPDEKGNDERMKYRALGKRLPEKYAYCICQHELCNGSELNGKIVGRSGAASARVKFGGGAKLILALLLILGYLSGPGDCSVSKCVSCTERTNPHCEDGEGESVQCNSNKGLYGSQKSEGCLNIQACASNYPCRLFRGCSSPRMAECMAPLNMKMGDASCRKLTYKMTIWSSWFSVCFDEFKKFYENDYKKRGKLHPGRFDRNRDSANHVNNVTIQYCYCEQDSCNGAETVGPQLEQVEGISVFVGAVTVPWLVSKLFFCDWLKTI